MANPPWTRTTAIAVAALPLAAVPAAKDRGNAVPAASGALRAARPGHDRGRVVRRAADRHTCYGTSPDDTIRAAPTEPIR